MGFDAVSFAWSDDVGAQSQVIAFVDLEFSYLGRRFALCRIPYIPTLALSTELKDARAWFPIARCTHSTTYLPNELLWHADIGGLRSLLAREERFVLRLDDHRVRVAMAQLIRRGVYGLFEQTEPSVARSTPQTSPPFQRGFAVPSPNRSPQTTFYARKPAEVTTALRGNASPEASSASASVAQQPDPIQALDQDAQAVTLITASQSGIPFCEQCARERQKQKQSA